MSALQIRAAELDSAPALDYQIADYLLSFWPALPDKHIRMNVSGPKYSWAKTDDDQHTPLAYADLLAHAAGEITIGAHLHDSTGRCRIGMLDIDRGGRTAVLTAIAAADQLGYAAYGLYSPSGPRAGAEHDGGRLVVPFADFANKRATIAVMEQIRDAAGLPANTEVWPGGGNAVALPFAVHLRKRTRGELLTQVGRVYRLDQADERAAALATIAALPLNAMPPATPAKPKPVPALIVKESPGERAVRINTTGQRIDARAIFAEVRERFNAAHDWAELLSMYGGVETRDGWACACGYPHAHATQIAITSQDKIVSYSPNCAWAPYKDSGKALDKFGYYVDRAYHGNYRRAGEALARAYDLWVEPQPRRYDQAPSPEPTVYRNQAKANDTTARREKRQQETRSALSAIYDQVAAHDLIYAVPAGIEPMRHDARARLLFVYLLDIAQTAGVLQIAPTNAQIVEALGICKRYVIYAFRELEAAGLGKRTGGKGGLDQPNEAATWTFYRAPNLGCKPQPDAACILDSKDSDLQPDLRSCERRAASPLDPHLGCKPQPDAACILDSKDSDLQPDLRSCERRAASPLDPPDLGEPDSLDTWAWYDAPIGADDIVVLDGLPIPVAESTALRQPRLLHCGPWHYIADGIECGPTCRTEAEAWMAWARPINTDLPNRATPAESACLRADLETAQAEQAASRVPDLAGVGEASYDPTLDWTAQDGPAPARLWRADLRPRDFERWNRRPDLGGAWELRQTMDAIEHEQQLALDAGDMPASIQPVKLFLLPARKPQQRKIRSSKAREQYMGALATRTEVELAGELRKHRNTLKKHAEAVWVDQIRDELVLVEAELDRRATGPPPGAEPAAAQFAHRSLCGAPSQAPPAPP